MLGHPFDHPSLPAMYDDHDDVSPEELLHGSAAPLRREHPLDSWQEIVPGMPSTWTPPAPQEAPTIAHPFTLRWHETLQDRWVGFWERRRQRAQKGPSQRAWHEVLDYYAGRYRDREPDPRAFARVVRRNGTPDWPNPFPEGHPRHYDYHPHGLVLMEITTLLEGMAQAMSAELAPSPTQDDEPRRNQVEWVTLDEALQDNEHDQIAKAQANQRLAMVAWAMMLAWGNGFSRTLQEVHLENLTAITLETLLVFDPKPWGMTLPKIAAGAVQAGFINLPTAQAVLRQRTTMDREDAQHANPAPPSPPSQAPKAPPLPVEAWQAQRAAKAAQAPAVVFTPVVVPSEGTRAASTEAVSPAPHAEQKTSDAPSSSVFDSPPSSR